MKFLARDEASLLEKKHRREIAEYGDPKFVLYYESGGRDYSTAANAIALSIGKFSEATVLFLFCVSGDGWDESSSTERGGTATEGGEPRLMRVVDCMKPLAIGSKRTRSNSYPKRSNFRLNSAGTLWSQQCPDDSFCSSPTTIGWKSTEAPVAACLSGN